MPGFDIGSSISSVAIRDKGIISVVTNAEGYRYTPSYVSFSGSLRYVGAIAERHETTNAKNTFVNFIQLVGKRASDPIVQREMQYPGSRFECHNDQVYFVTTINGEKVMFLPEQLLAMQLTKLKADAEQTLGYKIVDVAINVPTYYTDTERRAIIDASYIAGLKCTKLVNDMTAVATCYAFYRQLPAPESPPQIVAFINGGYTSTQVSICALNKGKIKVLSTVCDSFLGGRDFDIKLFNFFANEFKSKHKKNVTSLKSVLKLLKGCEKLKKSLTSTGIAIPIQVECLVEDIDFESSMNSADFENMCADLIARFDQLLLSSLQKANNLKPEGINSVEVVGGCCRIPFLRNIITNVFKQEAKSTMVADEAVAIGCTIQAAICSPHLSVKEISIKEVCLYPIQIRLIQAPGELIDIFLYNSSIPGLRRLELVGTLPMTFEAIYSDSLPVPTSDLILGRFTLRSEKVYEGPQKILLKFRMNIHGIFEVAQAQVIEVIEKEVEVDNPEVTSAAKADSADKDTPTDGDVNGSTNHDTPEASETANTQETKPLKIMKKKKFTTYHELIIDAITKQRNEKQLNDLIEVEMAITQREKLERRRIDAKNALETYVYEIRDELQASLKPFITPTDLEPFTQRLNEIESWLYEEGDCVNQEEYTKRLDELRGTGEAVRWRASESINRPAAMNAFIQSIEVVKGVCNSFAAGEPTYDHLSQEQIKQLSDCIVENEAWLAKQSQLQQDIPLYSTPVLKTIDIVEKKQVLEDVCRPIISTPKPAPPPPPPVNDNVNNDPKAQKKAAEENHHHHSKANAENNMDIDMNEN